jgi:hypothetical protein
MGWGVCGRGRGSVRRARNIGTDAAQPPTPEQPRWMCDSSSPMMLQIKPMNQSEHSNCELIHAQLATVSLQQVVRVAIDDRPDNAFTYTAPPNCTQLPVHKLNTLCALPRSIPPPHDHVAGHTVTT